LAYSKLRYLLPGKEPARRPQPTAHDDDLATPFKLLDSAFLQRSKVDVNSTLDKCEAELVDSKLLMTKPATDLARRTGGG
jgi:hypothetical protein